jgi:hypothetical protein
MLCWLNILRHSFAVLGKGRLDVRDAGLGCDASLHEVQDDGLLGREPVSQIRETLDHALLEDLQGIEALRQELHSHRLCLFLLEVGYRLPQVGYLRHFLIAPR